MGEKKEIYLKKHEETLKVENNQEISRILYTVNPSFPNFTVHKKKGFRFDLYSFNPKGMQPRHNVVWAL